MANPRILSADTVTGYGTGEDADWFEIHLGGVRGVEPQTNVRPEAYAVVDELVRQ